MTRLDLTPYFRNSIGIDRLTRMLEQADHVNTTGYPPYNIVSTGDDKYIIEMAIAGFTQNEITVSTHNGELVILGEKTETDDRTYLHHGISARKFRRVFNLADYVEVQSAVVKDGILTVYLERIIPEALKPKQIEVKVA